MCRLTLYLLVGLIPLANMFLINIPLSKDYERYRRQVGRYHQVAMQSNSFQTNQTHIASRLLTFARSHHAVECLQRIICQLSFQEMFFGEDGFAFGQRLKKLESMVREEDIIQYREARRFGLENRDPNNCRIRYPYCTYDIDRIIQVGLSLMRRLPNL